MSNLTSDGIVGSSFFQWKKYKSNLGNVFKSYAKSQYIIALLPIKVN